MEYVQMTLNDWMELKGQLEAELRGTAAGFVRIGYLLRKIDETEGYKNDGSKSLAEWAKDNYGLSASAVSRFVAINKKYSVDGYSDRLRVEFAKYGSAKLAEMLALPDTDLEMISPEMKREDIREIKKFNKDMEAEAKNRPTEQKPIETVAEEATAAGFVEPVPQKEYEWIMEFFRQNGDVMNELYSSAAYKNADYDAMKEIVNPSGARTFRHKATLISMLEGKVTVKRFRQSLETMSWERFFTAAEATLGHERIDGEATYRNVFGQDPSCPAEETQKKENGKAAKPAEKPKKPQQVTIEEPAEQIAPAQKSESDIVDNNVKTDFKEEEKEPEQVEIEEIMPAPAEADPMRDLKDRFGAEINSLKVLLDCENFEGMKQTIARLEQLRERMSTLKFMQG